jgi:hypothetical protein
MLERAQLISEAKTSLNQLDENIGHAQHLTKRAPGLKFQAPGSAALP